MADSDSSHGSTRFPRLQFRKGEGGYHAGRPCPPAAPRNELAPPRVTVRVAGCDGLVLRAAGPADLEAALALHGRCSPGTLAGRYHGPVAEADSYLRHLLSPRHGRSVVAETGAGQLVALGHLLWDGEESEVALLVEDAWQRRGVGSAVLRELIGLAERDGRETVYAVTRTSNAGMAAVLRATGLPVEHRAEEGALVLTARLSPAGGRGAQPSAALHGPARW
ncbi:GNAT family N-acetyltransferase [Streptomyces litchfieldiae]|uniref:GNAT family N-acetyltransferase n=1 Tax=Streptomyces litchfieldiae TaxID=3075543 RepID=UPI00374E05CB